MLEECISYDQIMLLERFDEVLTIWVYFIFAKFPYDFWMVSVGWTCLGVKVSCKD